MAAQEASRGDYWTNLGLEMTFSSVQAELFVNKTVGELLFFGYEDTLLAIASMMGAESSTPMDKMGYFYKVIIIKVQQTLVLRD